MSLRADNISLDLRGRQVLTDISVTFAPGAITVILGPNGAGKSSLLSCLAGLRQPTGGQVSLSGRALSEWASIERARQIALLAQNAEIHWDITARALVDLGRLPHRGRWAATQADGQAVEQALAQTDCAQLADRPVRQLSGGEQARVLLARALATQPAWLLADEPLANLDPAHQLDALACLKAVAASGVGVVLVLHDLTFAARIADHVVLLDKGRLAATGNATCLLDADLLAGVFGIRVHIGQDCDGAAVLTPLGRAD